MRAAETGNGMAVGNSYRFAVAPMMDWTDRHCRFFHRLMSGRALLYTEMIAAPALVRGRSTWLLEFDPSEHPVALQLGGADPGELAEAVRLGVEAGYDEINLNVGCPSDRVQGGCFGAVLMKDPKLVARCLRDMCNAANGTEVTVKCRLGVDDQDAETTLPRFLDEIAGAGVRRVAIHARKSLLDGLSPKQNRNVPPLNHELVFRMKNRFPGLKICLNGGINDLDLADECLERGIDGVMMGRTAYRNPAGVLMEVDRRLFGIDRQAGRNRIARQMFDYIEGQQQLGIRINRITRHMSGLFAGCPGARRWRQSLSDNRRLASEGTGFLAETLEQVSRPDPASEDGRPGHC